MLKYYDEGDGRVGARRVRVYVIGPDHPLVKSGAITLTKDGDGGGGGGGERSREGPSSEAGRVAAGAEIVDATPMRQRRLVLWGTLLHGADRSTRRLMVSLPNHPTIILH